jgi:cytochrome b561
MLHKWPHYLLQILITNLSLVVDPVPVRTRKGSEVPLEVLEDHKSVGVLVGILEVSRVVVLGDNPTVVD